MTGWINLGTFAYGLLDSTKNALKTAPMEYKYLVSVLLASMWCIAFGIFTAELLFIGYNIIGHLLVITCVFFTFFVFRTVGKEQVVESRQGFKQKSQTHWDQDL